jgi:hypothetical protein
MGDSTEIEVLLKPGDNFYTLRFGQLEQPITGYRCNTWLGKRTLFLNAVSMQLFAQEDPATGLWSVESIRFSVRDRMGIEVGGMMDVPQFLGLIGTSVEEQEWPTIVQDQDSTTKG